MYTVGLGIVKGNASGAASPSNEVLIVDAEKIKLPGTNAGGIRMVGNIIVDPNSRFEKIYSTKSKTEFPIEGEIEDIKAFYILLKNNNGEIVTFPNNLLMQKGISIVNEPIERNEFTD
jgi:hypothetical protein